MHGKVTMVAVVLTVAANGCGGSTTRSNTSVGPPLGTYLGPSKILGSTCGPPQTSPSCRLVMGDGSHWTCPGTGQRIDRNVVVGKTCTRR